jgi:TRAP-type C4-dicarboxylate transport system permease small subunit
MPASDPAAIVRPALADRFILVAERVAGAFLAFVTALTFVSVVLRYIFNWSIPDSYDLSRNFLGILIFWGIAVTGFRGDHITVDLLWGALPPPGKRGLDLLGTVFTLFCMAAFTWAMAIKVIDTYRDSEETYDIHMKVWPFYFVAWLGILAAVVLLLVRLYRQLRSPPGYGEAAIPTSH